MMITFQGLAKLKASQVIFEDAFVASDPGTLEQLKELSSRRRSIEFINKNSCVTEAIAREMSGGLTSRNEQAVAATKAEQKGTTGGLLAKLHYGVSEFLEKALCNMQLAIKNCKDISSHFMDYISSCKTLHELESYKYLAESLKNDGQTGAAIGVLHFALKSKQKHNKPKEESWRSVYNQIIDSMTALLQKYERENEVVWHEKIPAPDQLPSPEGVKIVSCIPYQPQKWERSLVFKF
nr:programmed cell death 6-interacting protein isoform X2 [Ipomoea batatas]